VKQVCPICKVKTSEARCPGCGMPLAARAAPPQARMIPRVPQRPRRASAPQKILVILISLLVPLLGWALPALRARQAAMPAFFITIPETSTSSKGLIQEKEGWLGDYYVNILSIDRGRDRWEKDAVIVTLEWTNGSDGARSFYSFLRCWVYRGDERLISTLWEDDEDGMLEYREIPPGGTQLVRCIYELDVPEGPIYVECSRAEWSDMVVRTFDALPQAQITSEQEN